MLVIYLVIVLTAFDCSSRLSSRSSSPLPVNHSIKRLADELTQEDMPGSHAIRHPNRFLSTAHRLRGGILQRQPMQTESYESRLKTAILLRPADSVKHLRQMLDNLASTKDGFSL